MSLNIYKPNQLISFINNLSEQKSNGILRLTTRVDTWHQQRVCILALHNGALTYAGTKVPGSKELCRKLGELLQPNMINAALEVAIKRASNPNSVVEILTLLIKMKIFTWQEVEVVMRNQLLLILEKFISHPGESQWVTSVDFDLSYGEDQHGLNWTNIKQKLQHRQQQWQNFAPQIPNMDAVPVVTTEQLQMIDNPQVKDHFRKSVDGNRNLVDIAEKMGKDPLKIAKNYVNWVNNGWVSFTNTSSSTRSIRDIRAKISANLEQAEVEGKNTADVDSKQTKEKAHLPTILSVDDSAIVQISIKRALQEKYNVLLADRAVKALEILKQQPVKLLLLDLTMPDVDGLQFCKTVRQIPQLKNLPIIMVTARDGLVNKAKGHIAGTNKYLTKPFEPEELREVVAEYISQE